ncbi:MAG: hypothetical protein AAGH15_07720 [Myxococcota bacterium]
MDPITQLQQKLTDSPVSQFWLKATRTQLAHAATFAAEMEKLQAKSFEQMSQSIDEAARLAKEGLGATQELVGAWRKLASDTVHEAVAESERA